MWQRQPRKVLYTLCVDDYAPEITALTFPLLRHYARRIGAEFHVIEERKYPEWPVTYEKLQVHALAQEKYADAEWHIFVDADALVHPECIDFTEHLPRDTVCHNGTDMAAVRWRYDRYFWRDGRNIGSCTWLVLASDWCLDLWRPLDDLTLGEAVENIRPTVAEVNAAEQITREHLIDDYTLSRNIARFGLKVTTVTEMLPKLGLPDAAFFWHKYGLTPQQKVEEMRAVLDGWRIADFFTRRGY